MVQGGPDTRDEYCDENRHDDGNTSALTRGRHHMIGHGQMEVPRRTRGVRFALAAALGIATLITAGESGITSAEGATASPMLEAPGDPSTVANPSFASVTPARFADTRPAGVTVDTKFAGAGRIAAGGQYEVGIAGRGSVPADAVGAIVELTAINPSATGFLTVHPCDPTPPTASTLNYIAGVDVANEVFVALSASGAVCVFSSSAADVAIDVVGYVQPDDSVKLASPKRLADSRTDGKTIDGESQSFGTTTAGADIKVKVAGRAGVPADATAAIVNVAAVRPTTPGFVSVDACVAGTPTASSLNHVPGVNRANELIAQIDSSGSICVYTDQPIDVIVDVVGWVLPGSDLKGLTPARFVDTRRGNKTIDGENQGGGPREAETKTRVKIAGRGDVPADASAVVVNVGAVAPTGKGFLTVDGCNTPRPNASSLSYTADVNGSNEIIVDLNADGELCIYNSAETNVIADVVGYVSPLISLQVLSFNDFHGHIEASTPGGVGAVEDAGGSEFLSAKLTELRTDGYSVTAAAGDLVGGSPAFSGLFHDEPAVEVLNQIGLDVSGVGNHEFDEGVTELLRLQNGGCHPVDGCYFPEEFAGADYQWLSANVVETATGTTPLPEYWIKDVSGVKVAFIGMTLEGTDALVSAAGIVGYDFKDEAETANALVPALQAQGVEAMVVLLHEGGSQVPPPGEIDACQGISGPIVAINAALDPAIDAIVTGHTHQPYNCRLDDSAGDPRIVTSAYSFGRVVSDIDVVLDRRTGDVDRDASTATNHIVDQAALTADPAVSAVIAKWQPLFDVVKDEEVGRISANINRGGAPPGQDRGVESSAGNLVADAHRASTGADIAFMNAGGLRSDLIFAKSGTETVDGIITFAEAFTFQPFGNNVLSFPMTGAQIISVLEEQCQPAGGRPVQHLGVSDGFTYDLTVVVTAGNCTSITVANVKLGGVALDPAATYTVAANIFLADGGDNFATFTEVNPLDRVDYGNDVEALRDYFTDAGVVAPPSTDRVNEVPAV
jgi:5'-nucleotidase